MDNNTKYSCLKHSHIRRASDREKKNKNNNIIYVFSNTPKFCTSTNNNRRYPFVYRWQYYNDTHLLNSQVK